MEVITIEVEPRSALGTGQLKAIRKAGNIPAVIYGEGGEPLPVMLTQHSYTVTMRGRPMTQLFELKSSDAKLNGQLALVKDIQAEPIKERVLHVDFQRISTGHAITVTVAVKLVGECAAVKLGNGVLTQNLRELQIEALPREIPSTLEADVSTLDLGHSLHAGEVPLPAGVKLKSDPKQTVATVLAKSGADDESSSSAAAAEGADADSTADTKES